MSHIIQVIDPATGSGYGVEIPDTQAELIDAMRERAEAGGTVPASYLRDMAAALEAQAHIAAVPTGDELAEDESTPAVDVKETDSAADLQIESLTTQLDAALGKAEGAETEKAAVEKQLVEAMTSIEELTGLKDAAENRVAELEDEVKTLEALLDKPAKKP